MYKNFSLTESEKEQILNMHKDHGYKKPLNEQSPQLTQTDYQEIANYFKGLMSGINVTSDASDSIETTIMNRINNKRDWEGVKKAFGVQDGQNLDQWLKGEFRIDFNRVMQLVNQKEGEFRKQDSMYNPGTKLRLITNRQFVMGRAYNYASSMRDKEEMNIDMENATVIRRDKDGIVVKVPYVYYYNVGERQRGGAIPKQERMDNPCIKIPFKEIIEFRDDTLQVSWFSDWVKSRVVPCK
jgi:hypothetical protein